MSIYALPSVNALMQKYSTIDTYRDVFVEQFREHQQHQRAEHQHEQERHQKQQQGQQQTADKQDPSVENEDSAPRNGAENSDETHPHSAYTGTRTHTNDTQAGAGGQSGKSEDKSSEKSAASGISDAEEDDFTAQEVFNKVLTDSVLYYLFVGTNMKNEEQKAAGQAGGQREDSGRQLSVVFQAFLQTAAFSYQNQPAQEGGDGDSGGNDRKAGERQGANEGGNKQREPKFTRHDHYD